MSTDDYFISVTTPRRIAEYLSTPSTSSMIQWHYPRPSGTSVVRSWSGDVYEAWKLVVIPKRLVYIVIQIGSWQMMSTEVLSKLLKRMTTPQDSITRRGLNGSSSHTK